MQNHIRYAGKEAVQLENRVLFEVPLFFKYTHTYNVPCGLYAYIMGTWYSVSLCLGGF